MEVSQKNAYERHRCDLGVNTGTQTWTVILRGKWKSN